MQNVEKKIITLYKKGTPKEVICKKTGYSYATIYCILRKSGVEMRKRQKVTPEIAKEIYKCYKKGMNNMQLAIKFELSISTIFNVLNKMRDEKEVI